MLHSSPTNVSFSRLRNNKIQGAHKKAAEKTTKNKGLSLEKKVYRHFWKASRRICKKQNKKDEPHQHSLFVYDRRLLLTLVEL